MNETEINSLSDHCLSTADSEIASEPKHQASCEQHSTHYTSLSENFIDDEDKTSLKEVAQSTLTEKDLPLKSDFQASKKSKNPRLRSFLRPRTWPNPFVQGRLVNILFFSPLLYIVLIHSRNNDENADFYKIFSILYGLGQ